MGTYIKYECDNCGYVFESLDQVFWIGEDGKVSVSALTMLSSLKKEDAPINGFYGVGYCYNCKKFVEKYIVQEKIPDISDETIFYLIEEFNDSPKVIEFDNKFQKCLTCNRDLDLKSQYQFAFDVNGEFVIEDAMHYFGDEENYKFIGEYYGYYCDECKKQINKFVIIKNIAGLSDDEIKSTLEEHTNDLTIYLNRDADVCPSCGENLGYLGDESDCPKCGEGTLTTEEITDFN